MLAIVGLGNPGSMYAGTRHNVGFDVVDALAERFKLHFSPRLEECLMAESFAPAKNFVLVKPLTYMNNSGVAVKGVLDEFQLLLSQIVVVVDDFHLPLGAMRLRLKGSSGGHNGLHSIMYHLQSEEFARLRCGIASTSMPHDKQKMADFVLSPFDTDERKTVCSMIDSACDTLMSAVNHGFGEATRQLSIQ